MLKMENRKAVKDKLFDFAESDLRIYHQGQLINYIEFRFYHTLT